MRKNTFLLVILAMVSLTTMAQTVDRSNFKAGVLAGMPVGDASDYSSFALGLDVAHHWGVSELFDAGIATGYIHAFGDNFTVTVDSFDGVSPASTQEIRAEDFQIIPVAATIRMYPTYEFKFGADVGYAVAVNDNMDGGFYIRPSIGYNITGNTELNVSYINVSNDWNFSMVSLGLLFLF